MTPERRTEIRRHAAHRAAAELDGVLNHWGGEVQSELYPDEDERDEFMNAMSAIVRQLRRRGGAV